MYIYSYIRTCINKINIQQQANRCVKLFVKYYKYELYNTNIPINVISGFLGLLVYNIHTYNNNINILKKVLWTPFLPFLIFYPYI